jgi:hypothetical protein
MYQFSIDPMFEHKHKPIGDPTVRYRLLRVYVPASIVDWSKAEVMGDNLTLEDAKALQKRLESSHNSE